MNIPFFTKLETSENILIVGAGGGFDVFCGLPLYFWLRKAGKKVHLANLSFTELGYCEGERPVPSLLRVLPNTNGPAVYFPELYLSQWLSDRFEETPVYAIQRSGVKKVVAAYEWLVSEIQPDTLILIDGGTDSLMRGDEAGLGTPQEDMASLYAAHSVNGPRQKFLVNIGFGIDAFHGVCHAQFLESVAALTADSAFLGTWSLMSSMEEFKLYREACEFVVARMSKEPSIVNSSIVSAVLGEFGNYHATKKTEGSVLFINPLMAIYWAFELEAVVRRNLYINQIGDTSSFYEISLAIEKFRATLTKTKLWTDIPC